MRKGSRSRARKEQMVVKRKAPSKRSKSRLDGGFRPSERGPAVAEPQQPQALRVPGRDGVSHYAQPLAFWETVHMLGDDDESALAAQLGRRPPRPDCICSTTLEGLDYDHWPPHNGF